MADYQGAAAAAGFLGFIGNQMQGTQNRTAARLNNEATMAHQKAEAELAYKRQVEMWERQNAYNSPEAQMARFKEAGLNPHLIYGQGTPGNATQMPTYQPARGEYNIPAGNFGTALTQLMPVVMQAGSWMMDMKQRELELAKTQQDMQRGAQGMDIGSLRMQLMEQTFRFLEQKHPEIIKQLSNQNSLFPYQAEIMKDTMLKVRTSLEDAQQTFRYKFGDDLFRDLYMGKGSSFKQQTGALSLKRIEQELINEGKRQGLSMNEIRRDLLRGNVQEQGLRLLSMGYQNKLLSAKSMFTDYGVTDPQRLVEFVGSGIGNVMQSLMRMKSMNPKGRRPKARHRQHEDSDKDYVDTYYYE